MRGLTPLLQDVYICQFTFGRLKQVSYKNVLVFATVHHTFNSVWYQALLITNIFTISCYRHHASPCSWCSGGDDSCCISATGSVFPYALVVQRIIIDP